MNPDGNIHVVPVDGEPHAESASCWCNPVWDLKNKIDWCLSVADDKVYIHKSIEELIQ